MKPAKQGTESSSLKIRPATDADTGVVSEILLDAADWLISKGEKLWDGADLTPEKIGPDIKAGKYWVAEIDGTIAGCLRFQEEDQEYWDDVPHEDSAFVHRVAVRRGFAGREIPKKMIDRAKQVARSKGKKFLRLDCADRPKLRAVYEEMGFSYHSVKERTPYIVIRYEYNLIN